MGAARDRPSNIGENGLHESPPKRGLVHCIHEDGKLIQFIGRDIFRFQKNFPLKGNVWAYIIKRNIQNPRPFLRTQHLSDVFGGILFRLSLIPEFFPEL